MARIFPEHKRSTVYAVIGAIFHFVLLMLMYFFNFFEVREGVRPLGYLIAFMDWPLFLLGKSFRMLTSSSVIFTVCGTLLYALIGWFIGFLTDMFLKWRLRKWEF